MHTWLTERFGLTVPIVSAPMAGAAGGRLAAAVSRAGALGMIGVPHYPGPAWLEQQIDLAADTGRPYGIGLVGWHLGPAGSDPVLAHVRTAAPALVSVSYPVRSDLVPWLQDGGSTVATQVGTLSEARAAVEAGVDIVVARGSEGGGHGRDAVSTLVLLQQVLDDFAEHDLDVPVLGAGGIGSRRGLAAVLAAGAVGAWVGSAFLACPEADTSSAIRDAVLGADATDTTYSRTYDLALGNAWPPQYGSRTLANTVTRGWADRESDLVAGGPEVDRLADLLRTAHADGDVSRSAVTVGQVAGLVHRIRPAADVVADLAAPVPAR